MSDAPARTMLDLRLMKARRERIVALTCYDGLFARLLDQSGVSYRCVYTGSTPEAFDDTVADFFKLSSAPVAASPWFEEQFNAENQTLALDAIIRSLHSGPMRGTNP